MTELTTVDQVAEAPIPSTLIALAPQDVPAAQQEIVRFCRRQIRILAVEARELKQSLEVATRNRWGRSSLLKAKSRLKGLLTYYRKIQAAVEAGYLIVPNLDVTVMALRVSEDQCPRQDTDVSKQRLLPTTASDLPLLPAGQGEYVGPKAKAKRTSLPAATPTEPYKTKPGWKNTYDFQPVAFPIRAVKPQILDATGLAMTHKIFDRIGVVGNKRQDPLVVGEIFHPDDRWRQRRVTFMLAWWLDLEALK